MKKKLNLPMLLMFVIIGSAALRNFDFETMQFEKFWLGMLYIFTLLVILIVMVKPFLSKEQEQPQAIDKSGKK